MKDNNGWIVQPKITTKQYSWNNIQDKYLYLGNLPVTSPQYKSDLFVGLTLNPIHDKEIKHDCTKLFPLKNNSVIGLQAEDVFEHIEYNKIPEIFNEIYRVLKPDALFRLSLPDYNCPLLRERSVYDCYGNWLCDLAVGGSVYASFNEKTKVTFIPGGDSHVWNPTFENVKKLISFSYLKNCQIIKFFHYWENYTNFVCKPFEQIIMPVQRTPPKDMRANGAPVSIVVDFVKTKI